MKIDGQCQCGVVRFEAEIDPSKVTVCHCTDCQQFSGSPWRASVPAAAGDFRITAGRPATYIKTAESGTKRLQAFCGNCGSALYSAASENTAAFGIRLGSVNQRALLAPNKQIWTRSALPWASDIHGLPASACEWRAS
jgi:hypothetical protein